jgi:hypothetical protein
LLTADFDRSVASLRKLLEDLGRRYAEMGADVQPSR